jgi:hypothetical protein
MVSVFRLVDPRFLQHHQQFSVALQVTALQESDMFFGDTAWMTLNPSI